MTEHYCEVHAAVNPDHLEEFPNGIRRQQIELVFTDDRERPWWRALEPAVCAIDSLRGRELAFELLTPAEVAECWEPTQ
jgi:hypothetical protein